MERRIAERKKGRREERRKIIVPIFLSCGRFIILVANNQ